MGLLKERLEQLDKETGGDLGERINSLAEKLPQMQGLRPLTSSLGAAPGLTPKQIVRLAVIVGLISSGDAHPASPSDMRKANKWAAEMTDAFFEYDE